MDQPPLTRMTAPDPTAKSPPRTKGHATHAADGSTAAMMIPVMKRITPISTRATLMTLYSSKFVYNIVVNTGRTD